MSKAINKRNSAGGRIVLFLFASPFALIGIGMLFLAVIPSIYDSIRMQSWVPVEAQLISSDLKRHYGKKSTTYQVVADYRYSYQGQAYRGHRVGINEKSDNIGDWHRRTYSRLTSAHPLQVWVNPHDPSESIFDRDLRWGVQGFYMIFVLVFGGVGVGLMWFALRKRPSIPDGVPLWQGNPAWRDNQIRSNAKAGLWFIWVFAAIWNLISSPVLFVIPKEWAKGNHVVLAALLFPLVGLSLIIYALKLTLGWRRFGATPLQLDPFPGSIGGDVGGSIQLNQALPRNAVVQVQLSCVYVYTSGTGKNRQTSRNVKWQDQQQVAAENSYKGSLIKFRFAVPKDLPASEDNNMPYHEWTLEVSCELPGADLDRTYTIPVCETDTPKQSTVRARPVANTTNAPLVPAKVMQTSQTGSGLRLHFPILRGLSPGFTGTSVGAIFVGLSWMFIYGGMKHPPPAIFPVVFGLVGSLASLGGLYTLGNSLTVVANSMHIEVTRRIFGLAFSKRIPVGNIKSLQVVKGLQSSQGSKVTVYYKVKLYTHDGKKVTVAESLTGVSTAQQVAKQIEAACHIQATDW